MRHAVELSPFANFTFRVFARNKLGVSAPSEVSAVCGTPVDTPDRNPRQVEGKGRSPTDMVISWEVGTSHWSGEGGDKPDRNLTETSQRKRKVAYRHGHLVGGRH